MELVMMAVKELFVLIWRWIQFSLLFLPLPAITLFIAHILMKQKRTVAVVVAVGLLINIGAVLWAADHPVMIVPEEYAGQLSDEEISSLRGSEAGISWLLGSPAIPITVTVYSVGGNYPADGYLRTSTRCFPLGGWRTQYADGLDRYDIWADGIREPVGDRLSGMG